MLKKLFMLTIGLILLLSACSLENSTFQENGSVTEEFKATQASTQPIVQLLRASRFDMSKYGVSWVNNSYTVAVKNIGYEKNVSLWGKNNEGEWMSYPLEFKCIVNSEIEIWNLHINSGPSEFVVKYEVNGTTYWDNNNGQNYRLDSQGITLFNDYKVLVWTDSFSSNNGTSYFSLSVHLQNLAYSKTVKVIYTTDNWNTIQEKSLNYQSYQTYGYGYAPSPNAAGVELWTGYVTLEGSYSSLQYAVVYEVEGSTYWDNNFGSNYTLTN